jgi:hypothetical protein
MDDIVLVKARVYYVSATESLGTDGQWFLDYEKHTSLIRFSGGEETSLRKYETYSHDSSTGKTITKLAGYYVAEKLEVGEEYEMVLRKVNKPVPHGQQENHRVFQEDETSPTTEMDDTPI